MPELPGAAAGASPREPGWEAAMPGRVRPTGPETVQAVTFFPAMSPLDGQMTRWHRYRLNLGGKSPGTLALGKSTAVDSGHSHERRWAAVTTLVNHPEPGPNEWGRIPCQQS